MEEEPVATAGTPTSESESGTVNALPPEILSQVFWNLPRLVLDDIHKPIPPWAVVLHVCRKWREISLGYADLWTLIPLGTVQWTELALRLSYPCAIDLHFPDPVLSRHHEPIYAAIKECHRSYALDLRPTFDNKGISDITLEDTIFTALRDYPPAHIERFSLSSMALWGKDNIFYENTFLASSRVRYMRLTKCFFPKNFIFPTTLVSLRLEYTIFDDWTFQHVTDLLSSLPLLEDVSLVSLFMSTNFAELISTSSITPIAIPRIKTVNLIAEIETIIAYLLLMDLPLHGDLVLAIICLESPPRQSWQAAPRLSSEQSYALLFPILARYLRVVVARDYLHILLSKKAESVIRCTVRAGGVSISCGLPSPSTLAELLPESACRAGLVCDSSLPSLTLPALVWKTSPYMEHITLPNLLPLSSCSLVTDANLDLPNLREIAFTEPQDMADDGDGSSFQELLLVLRNTAASVVFEEGLKLNDEQMKTLVHEYPGRVII